MSEVGASSTTRAVEEEEEEAVDNAAEGAKLVKSLEVGHNFFVMVISNFSTFAAYYEIHMVYSICYEIQVHRFRLY